VRILARKIYPLRKAKICVRENGRMVCRQIEIERGVWEGHLSDVSSCVRRGIELITKEGRPYSEVVSQLNLLRVWNKRYNPELCRRLTTCIREIASKLGKRTRVKDIC